MIVQITKKVIPKSIRDKIKPLIFNIFSLPKYDSKKQYIINTTGNGEFKDKISLIIGGAGSIGRAICLRLAIEGSTVFVAGRTKSTIESVVKEITNIHGKAYPLIMDVTDNKSIAMSLNFIIKKFGKLDILINCAGGKIERCQPKNLHEQTIETIDDILNVNLRGVLLCSRLVAQQMIQQQNGKIINFSSVIGLQGKEKFSDYAAAKSGIIGFTKSLAIELGAYGINVNCVTPGYIARGKFSERKAKKIKETNFLKQIGTPEDISNVAVFLASEKARFITGQNFIVDGGRTLGLVGD